MESQRLWAVSQAKTWASSTRVADIAGAGDFNSAPAKTAFCGATPTATRSCGIPMVRAGSQAKTWGVVNTSWQIAGAGDFNGTGEDSILWRNTNGDTELWNPNGSGGFTGENLGVVNTSWQIAGNSGDFTGTGQDSILWRNTNGDTELWNPNGSGGFTGENLGVVNTSGRLQELATSPGRAKTTFCGATTNGDTELVESQRLGRFHRGENLGVVSTSWAVQKVFA